MMSTEFTEKTENSCHLCKKTLPAFHLRVPCFLPIQFPKSTYSYIVLYCCLYMYSSNDTSLISSGISITNNSYFVNTILSLNNISLYLIFIIISLYFIRYEAKRYRMSDFCGNLFITIILSFLPSLFRKST